MAVQEKGMYDINAAGTFARLQVYRRFALNPWAPSPRVRQEPGGEVRLGAIMISVRPTFPDRKAPW